MRKIYVLLVLLAGVNCAFAQKNKPSNEIIAKPYLLAYLESDDEKNTTIDTIFLKKQFQLVSDTVRGRYLLRTNTTLKNERVCVYDILGNCISRSAMTGMTEREINICGRPAGTYFVHIFSGEKIEASLRIDMK